MKIMFVNMRGLGGRPKKLTLRWILGWELPDILFLQETMGKGDSIIA
jgi:exonuclease III